MMKMENTDYCDCSLCGMRIDCNDEANFELKICNNCIENYKRCAQITDKEKNIVVLLGIFVAAPLSFIIVGFMFENIFYFNPAKMQHPMIGLYLAYCLFLICIFAFIVIIEKLVEKFRKNK